MASTPPKPITSIRDPVQEAGELHFSVAGPAGEREIRFWGDVPPSVDPPVEVALASVLPAAMAGGGGLALPAPVDPSLRRALADIQAVLESIAAGCYAVDEALAPVEVTAPERRSAGADGGGPRPDRGVGAFFSGGVDSWATLLANPDVTDLIYVHGYDIPLDRADVSAQVEGRLAAAAAAEGKRLHVVRTNLRALLDASVSWEVAHGPALAAVALLFEPSLRRILIGSTATYANPVARGSHPLHDHLWSTASCRIEHWGAHLPRTAKVELLAEHQPALDVLRVCWQNVDRYNCGRCEKCLRTMVAMEAVGALERCPTFAADLDLDRVATLRFADEDLPTWWRENLELARRRRPGSPLVAAIEACLAANEPPAREEPELTALREQLTAAEAREGALTRDLNAVVSSRSWRLTRPLRRAGSALRRLRRGGAG